MAKKQTKFSAWINTKGDSYLADILNVTEGSAGHWRRGHCIPRPAHMKKIVEMSRGRISYEDIIENYLSKQ